MRAELRRHNEETPIQRVKIIMERDLGILKWYERCQKRNGIANEKYTSSSLPFGSVSSGSTSTSQGGASELESRPLSILAIKLLEGTNEIG